MKFIQEPPRSEDRRLTDIARAELYLCHFIVEIRKPYGEEYEPDLLTSFNNSSERHLRQQHYPLIKIPKLYCKAPRSFIVKAKRKTLTGKGIGRKPISSQPRSKKDRVKCLNAAFWDVTITSG